jgi:Chalcone isomerase-like
MILTLNPAQMFHHRCRGKHETHCFCLCQHSDMPEMTWSASMGRQFRFAMRPLAIAASAVTFMASQAHALAVSGVSLAETTTVGKETLVVNGAGLRAVAMFRAYVVALYLPRTANDVGRVLSMEGAKRLHLVTMRDLHGKDLGHSMRQTMVTNLGETELAILNSRLEALEVAMNGLGELPKGAIIELDFQPGVGTSVQVNDKKVLDQVPGADFYRAILMIWLGEHPVGEHLKQTLLGAAP